MSAKVALTRSVARPERHVADSFITLRRAIARALIAWLPRCPACHQPRSHRRVAPPAFAISLTQ